MLYLEKFLYEHPNNWEELLTAAPYYLSISRKDDFILFKYDQIRSDFSIPLVREARGIIFYEPTWYVVCHAFDKFFNYGEPNASSIDWNSAEVTEKIDGSLIKIWSFRGKWHISTNNTIDAKDAPVPGFDDLTFYDLVVKGLIDACFKEVYISEMFDNFFSNNKTHCFELVSPLTQVVVPYKKTELYYLGSRSHYYDTFRQDIFLSNTFKTPKTYDLCDISYERLRAIADNMSWDQEGFVVTDSNDNRVKIKSPAYILAHYARNNNVMTPERLMDVIMHNEIDEFLVYADEHKERLMQIKNKKEAYLERAEKALNALSQHLGDERSQYARLVHEHDKDLHWIAFKKYDYPEKTLDDIVSNLDAKKWVRILNL